MVCAMCKCVVALVVLAVVAGDPKVKSQRSCPIPDHHSPIRCEECEKGAPCNIRAAVILPKDASLHEPSLPKVIPALQLARDHVVARGILPSNFDMTFISSDDRCQATYSSALAVDAYANDCVHVFLGPACEFSLAAVARMVRFWGTPLLSAGGLSFDYVLNKTSCDDEYHMLIRVGSLSYKSMAEFILAIMDKFSWTRVLLVYDKNGYAEVAGENTCKLFMESLVSELKNKTFLYQAYDTEKYPLDSFNETLKREMHQLYSIVVVCANPKTVRDILLAAYDLNMVGSGEYVFFNIELFSSMNENSLQPWYVKEDTEERNERAKKAYEALLTVTARTPNNTLYSNFSKDVKQLAADQYNYTFSNDSVSTFVTAFYDAVLLYSLALNETLQDGGTERDGAAITRRMWNRTFAGIAGDVTIDDNGDRIADYSLMDMDPDTHKFHTVANYIGANRTLQMVEGKSIHWAGGRTGPPPDTPKCGFDNSLCPDRSLPDYAILSIVLSSVVVVLAVASVFIYRHFKLEAAIASMNWRVHWPDVILMPHGKTRGSLCSLAKRGSQVSLSEDAMSIGETNRQVFMPTAFYKGSKVALKLIHKPRIELTRPLLLELKRMKDLHHDHLVRFLGACVDAPNSYLLTEYCPKGSLQDILENEQFKLDWMFRYSLMHDLVKGMSYLHSSDVRSHGSLKSSNCVVDSRFVLKIADFGLCSLRGGQDEHEDSDSYAYWRRLLWTSPELLRMSNRPSEGTQKLL